MGTFRKSIRVHLREMGATGKILLVVFLARFLFIRLNSLGYFRTDVPDEDILNIFDGYECIDGEQMKGQGAEDMVVTIENVALITSGLMWPVFQEKSKIGKIYSLDLEVPNQKEFQEVPLLNTPDDFKFTPHGLDIFETDDGRTLVYVVNHGSTDSLGEQEGVVKFQYDHDQNTLNFINNFQADQLLSVNDLTVISEDEFYFTNDSGFSHQSHSSLRLLEMFVFPIFKGFGSVGYCNDGSCKIVSNHWQIANGIQHRKTGDDIKLYISEFREGIHIYTVEQNNNIKYEKDLEAGDLGVINGVDNLTKMPNGNILTNAHRPKWNSEMTFLQIINPFYYPVGHIVNQIFEIDSNDNAKRLFFSGDTQHISQLSASVISENYVILGNPFSACRLCFRPKAEEKIMEKVDEKLDEK